MLSHSGPLCHSRFTDNSSNVKPLESRSAGLVLPEQWFQQFGGTSRLISATLLWTKGFHSLFVPHIQNNATWESVKHLISVSGRVDLRLSDTEVREGALTRTQVSVWSVLEVELLESLLPQILRMCLLRSSISGKQQQHKLWWRHRRSRRGDMK